MPPDFHFRMISFTLCKFCLKKKPNKNNNNKIHQKKKRSLKLVQGLTWDSEPVIRSANTCCAPMGWKAGLSRLLLPRWVSPPVLQAVTLGPGVGWGIPCPWGSHSSSLHHQGSPCPPWSCQASLTDPSLSSSTTPDRPQGGPRKAQNRPDPS